MDNKTREQVKKINELAKLWLRDYKNNGLESQRELKSQYKEMYAALEKTNKLLQDAPKTSGDSHADGDNWQQLYEGIETIVKANPFFAGCFGTIQEDPLANGASAEAKKVAAKIKPMAADWLGNYGELKEVTGVQKSLIAAIYDQASKIITAPKLGGATDDEHTVVFIGAKKGVSRKMAPKIKRLPDFFPELLVEIHEVEANDKLLKKHDIEHLPTILFMRGKREIARHEGELSSSMIQKKVNQLVQGMSFTDSDSVDKLLDGNKQLTEKELYSMGEFMIFYFEAVWCGACKKSDGIIDAAVAQYPGQAKLKKVMVDGRTMLHKQYNVDMVPTILFMHDGKEMGRHVGYIQPSTLNQKMRIFMANKGNIGNSKDALASPIGTEYDKQKEKEKEKLGLLSDLGGKVGESAANAPTDVHLIQELLNKHGFAVALDAKAGPEVIEAIKQFQEAAGVEATGTVAPNSPTWKALQGNKVKKTDSKSDKKVMDNDPLPTAKELSDRFGSSFKSLIPQIQKDTNLIIQGNPDFPQNGVKYAAELIALELANKYKKYGLKDSKGNLDLELTTIEVSIEDKQKAKENEDIESIQSLSSDDYDHSSYSIISNSLQRNYPDGVVFNPGMGQGAGDAIKFDITDELNKRVLNLYIKYKYQVFNNKKKE
ncbi:MAG: hypothetical protein GY810_09260 [Aureispira sp.]|nr:hypothetical protein [Aureispira sp.]